MLKNKLNSIMSPESNFRHFLLLLVLGITMLLIRIVPIYSRIFTDWPGEYGNYVNFSADDAVYHMRLVHNTLHHFPTRIFFDPFTYFPFGSYISFGPLFTLIIATAALIAGFGHPTPELVNHVGAYVPPIMGTLCLIPLYFITRKLFGKTAAIIASFVLAFLPGVFLSHSALGFTDHHVAEVLFSTITCAFLIYALDAAKSCNFTFAHIKYKNNRRVLTYGLLAGIAFGLFVLTWHGAQMFGIIFLIFFITQLIIDHFANNNTEYLLLLMVLLFIPPTIMVLPYVPMHPHFDIQLYPLYIPVILPAMVVIFTICYLLHLGLSRNKSIRSWYILALIITFFLLVLAIKIIFPHFYGFICYGYNYLFHPTPGMATVAEVRPSILDLNGNFSIQNFWSSLFWTIPLSIIGLGCLTYRIHNTKRPAEIFLLVWAIAIIIAASAQIRFNYDLAINAAILSSLGICQIVSLICYFEPKRKLYLRLQKCSIFILLLIFAFFIVDPILMFLIDHSIPSGIQIKQDWYNALIWLKKHTPDPQGKNIDKNFDYAAGYYAIPKNLRTHYNYPKSAYGIMAWWDVGHQITYIAERIPNSNNHQQGIIEKNNTNGASLFFTSTNEKQAIKNLTEIGSRYIIVTHHMALNQFKGMGIWCNDTKGWESYTKIKTKSGKKIYNFNNMPIDSPKFLHSMINRLFYNDTNGLQHFRLIYEDKGNYLVKVNGITLKPSVQFINKTINFEKYNTALKNMEEINSVLANKRGTDFLYKARLPVKRIKIFEKVIGATIIGETANNIVENTQVNLILKLKTRDNRTFSYKQTTKVNSGKYKFTVPYPTTEMRGNDYSYDIQSIGDYQIKIKNKIIKVSVPEKAVMFGNTIKIARIL